MPPRRDALTQRAPTTSIINVRVGYETPFWRARGLSGSILSDRVERLGLREPVGGVA